jgi:hypothetical protein
MCYAVTNEHEKNAGRKVRRGGCMSCVCMCVCKQKWENYRVKRQQSSSTGSPEEMRNLKWNGKQVKISYKRGKSFTLTTSTTTTMREQKRKTRVT